MKVQLMLTCLCDALFGEVGIATVRILEHCGVHVEFPPNQTCCGQPAFNSGEWTTARSVTKRFLDQFQPGTPIITPSASCALMLRHHSHELGIDITPWRIFELSEFLIDELGVTKWPLRGNRASKPQQIRFHGACHARQLEIGDRPLQLLRMVSGVTVAVPDQSEQCCGFGGMFAATQPDLSAGIGSEKLLRLRIASPHRVVSGDMGCLMHLQALASKQGEPIEIAHYAQILAEAIS